MNGCILWPGRIIATVHETSRRIKMAWPIGGVVAAAMLSRCPSRAPRKRQQHHDWSAERWKAQWIAWPEAPQRDTGIFHFRKTIELRELPKQFLVHVSADNRFICL